MNTFTLKNGNIVTVFPKMVAGHYVVIHHDKDGNVKKMWESNDLPKALEHIDTEAWAGPAGGVYARFLKKQQPD